MSLTKIDDIYLYTGLTASANNSYAAKKWFDEQGIEYIFMHYGNEAEHASLFAALDTWWPGEHTFTDFPFVVYTEIHDDLSPRNYPRICLYGLDNIVNSNLPQLYQLGRPTFVVNSAVSSSTV